MRALLAVLVCLALHCDRPVLDGGRASTLSEATAPAPPASAARPVTPEPSAARTITSIGYANQTASGGVSLTCTHDGVAGGSYFNPGFSSAGAEIIPVSKTLTPARVAELWSAAEAVVQALPTSHEAQDPGWRGHGSIVIHFSAGADVVLFWPGDGAHPDSHVQRLAALLAQVLSDR